MAPPKSIEFPNGKLFAYMDQVCRAEEDCVATYTQLDGMYDEILEFIDADLPTRKRICELLGADTTFLADQYGDIEGWEDEGDDA